MDVEQDSSGFSGVPGIDHLVDSARECGEDDQYAGKRSWTRYKAGMQLDLTTDPANPAATAAVVMENASSGGCSFWSKREHQEGAVVFVRRFSPMGETEWLPAAVHHCTVGIRGFLVGVAFEGTTTEESIACVRDSNAMPHCPAVGSAAPLSHRSGILRRLRRAGKKK